MRNEVEFAKRVIGIAASSASGLSESVWGDLCRKVIDPLMERIARVGNVIVIGGKSYKLEDIPASTADSLFMELDSTEAKDYVYRTYTYASLTKEYSKLLETPPIVNNADVAKRISEGGSIESEISSRLVPSVAFVEIAEEFEGKIDSRFVKELLNVALIINAEFTSIISSSTLSVGKRAKTVRDRLDSLSEQEPATNMTIDPTDKVEASKIESKPASEDVTPNSAEEPVASAETTSPSFQGQDVKDSTESEDEGFKFVGEASTPTPESTSSVSSSPDYPRKENMGVDSISSDRETGDGSDESSDDDDAKSEEDVDSESFD